MSRSCTRSGHRGQRAYSCLVAAEGLCTNAVRTRFLGTIAAPTLDASPVHAMKRLWGGEFPEFNDLAAVNELVEALMRLWNEVAQHQSHAKPYRLVRMTTTPDPDHLQRVCRTRVEELEGFIDGLFGDEDAIDLPERATEALHHLGEITAMIRGVLALMERESAPPASDQDVVRMLGEVRELSRIAEKELHALVLSCTRVRRQVLATIAVDKPTIH